MSLPPSAIDHYREQQAVTVVTAQQVDRIWSGMTEDFDESWSRLSPSVFETTTAGQYAAATSGSRYVGAIITETGIDAPPVAVVNPMRFVGGTRDGRPLESLLDGAVYKTKTAVGAGLPVRSALTAGRDWLLDAVMDSVRDADRQSVGAGMTVRPKLQGWVRMMNPPSCKFCIMLAGRFFRWNEGFQSHRRCDCRHIPSQESMAGDYTVDPDRFFASMKPSEQDRIFGKNDAQAIRDGADLNRVVNIRSRGLADDALKRTPGRNLGWQARRWDVPSQMTVDDVYRAATDRDDAIRLLGENGFLR